MQYFKDKAENILAIVLRSDYNPVKTEFYTPDFFSQQLGTIKYPAGHKIKAHYHNLVDRQVQLTQEVLFIKKGKVKVSLYDRDLVHVTDIILNQYDVILLASGGHGFEMEEDSEMIEVKQGPYNGIENDKTHF
jgi:hypothetical protein